MTDTTTVNSNLTLERTYSMCENVSCDHSVFKLNVEISKGRVHLSTGHKAPEGDYMYSYTFSLTSALDGVGVQGHSPAALPPGNTQYPLGGPQARSRRMRKISPQPGLDPRTVHL
jgi:hypothetical protein